jgi:hypothetical protein
MADPISNPGVSPIQPPTSPTEGPSGAKGVGPEGQKPFTFPEELPTKEGPQVETGKKPTPMEASQERGAKPRWTPEELNDNVKGLQEKLANAKNRLNGPEKANLTSDHEAALKKLTDRLTPDIKKIAKAANSDFSPPAQKKGGVLEYITEWIDGTQGTLGGALSYLEQKPPQSPEEFLKLQFSIQRATQRGELFSSIIGSSVSGLKTLMSTQLG